jgi:hypothetical protein
MGRGRPGTPLLMVKPILIRLCDKADWGPYAWGVERLSSRRVAGLTVYVTVAVATAASLAAYSAYAMRPQVTADLAITAFAVEQQTTNRAAKANRLAALLPMRVASNDDQAAYSLASAEPVAEPERPANPVIAATPAIPPEALAPVAAAAEPKQASAPAAPGPHEKPKHLLPPPPPAPAPAANSNVLDDGQIAGLKGRLRLTSDQVEYWPAVEAALRDVVRTQLRGMHNKFARSTTMTLDVNAPEVQKLIWAAMPLLARLREDQKSEVRKLARVIGLEQVASQI